MANDDLIARLEAAEGPQFVLDVEIWKTCHPADWKWQHGRFNPPAYTASIDAALTLCPDQRGPYSAWNWAVRYVQNAATPALAIVIAALKARSHD